MKNKILVLITVIVVLILMLIILICCSNNNQEIKSEEGVTFNAVIVKMHEYNGVTTLLISETEDNDVKHGGEFDFGINNENDEIELLWKGKKIEVSDLKVGQKISVTFSGGIMERYPGGLMGVKKVVVLDKKLDSVK